MADAARDTASISGAGDIGSGQARPWSATEANRTSRRPGSHAWQTIGAGGPRMAALDGLRSLVVLILLVHFTDHVALSEGAAIIFYALQCLGMFGLDMFFALSGFLITGILLDTKRAPHYFRNFFVRRCLRILPLYYGCLVVFLIVLPYGTSTFPDLRLTRDQHLWYWAYIVNVAGGLNWSIAPATGHFWSLSVEEQFYLAWPFIVFACRPTLLRRVCIACLLIAPIARIVLLDFAPGTFAAVFLTPARLDGLALGGLLALAARSERGLSSIRAFVVPVALLATVVGIGAAILSTPALPAGGFGLGMAIYLTASVYAGATLVAGTLLAPPDSRWLKFVGSWPLRRIGLYSYGIYVLHDPLVHVLDRVGLVPVPEAGIGPTLVYWAIMVPICIAAGALSWHLYERPFLRLQRAFAYQKPSPAPDPDTTSKVAAA